MSSLDPIYEFSADPLIGAKIYARGGRFEHATFPNEKILDFDIVFKQGSTEILSSSIQNINATAHEFDTPISPLFPSSTEAVAHINASAAPSAIKSYYVARADTMNGFTTFSRNWNNSMLESVLESDLSVAAKGLLGAQEKAANNKTQISLVFEAFNIWRLSGQINDGILMNN